MRLLAAVGGWVQQSRVLRGGSFDNNRRNARCANRNRNNPNNRNRNIGFRVVASTLFSNQKCGALKGSPPRSEERRNPSLAAYPRFRAPFVLMESLKRGPGK
ncbi:MAG: SUMF1/EgtB/PvdO family nonheme iron enzyme [Deltaproteobacteria bacterium]|nr:SUMF1/EgtB/PvdO family nonheme iron enzyme [Deltaproteobacteria bacterium]